MLRLITPHAFPRIPLLWCFGILCGLLAGTVYGPATLRAQPPDKVSRNVPLWAKGAVWYQIFPERFRNGDPGNDPRVTDIAGSWPHEKPDEWHVSEWTGDWYRLQEWETQGDRGFYYRVQQRRYGGDLQGVLDRLDYLKDLGINAIYFNPVFESPSLHKYDATMYHHIDNNFGPDPDGDRRIWESENPADPATWHWTSADRLFLQVVDEAHKRGIRVIIDGVFNHVGMTFWAFLDVKKKGRASAYKDWFIIKQWDDPSTTDNEFDYAGWYGVRELPEIREDEDGIVSGPREHIRHIVRRWMDPNGDGDPGDGIDGWRLDVAEMVAIPFWRTFRQWVREINPEAYLVGEVWWEDWKENRMFNAAPWLQGDVFDAVMNYRWAREAVNFFIAQKNKITPSEFMRRLAALRADYPTENNYALMNLMDSHDTDRLSSHIVNVDASYDKHVGVNDNRSYSVRKPDAEEINTQKLVALFQMTCLGAPGIYYGTETGMWGADDPDCRKPMLWPDMQYADEVSHPFGAGRPADKNAFNDELFLHYQTLIRVRTANQALSLGTWETLEADDEKDLIAFLRSYGDNHVLVIINNSREEQDVALTLPAQLDGLKWINEMGSQPFHAGSGNFHTSVPPRSGMIVSAGSQ